jgi:CheY-like chemotaxis protein
VNVSVLVVDDHTSFRRLASRMLGAGGYRVVGEAADVASAVEAVRRLRPDVVLLDVLLPDGDGVDLADLLPTLEYRPFVVLTSSRTASELGPRIEGDGRAFIAKSDLTIRSFDSVLEAAEWLH